ncbi:T-cell surface antigen CD2-like isoform X4 [Acanthochromis polyacanthus]|uniref:T-cell surface antigen CD2-like isoform X4 n=1 Tax=Acanthochromis polyacanthus TaxID=80966 RepID=UPI002234112E|nr:T-cell surface antigen CD2-like isoform X4 [Acanthochromis polyacanthus]
MGAVVGLLLLLIGVSHGLETSCDGRKDGAQCYGALGGTVNLQLMDSASEIPRYEWSNKSTKILHGRKNKIISNGISVRSVFTPSNGTFRINDLSRNDIGEYKLIIYNSSLQKSGERTLHLSVQAPVSSVLLVSECLQGEMRVSCSSVGGDHPQYNWTLDGRELTDDDLLSGNTESENITLKANVSGYLVCSVRNRFSDVCGFTINNCTSSNGTQKWVHESNDTICIIPTTTTTSTTSTVGKLPLIGGVLGALLILLIVGVAVVCSQKKKQRTKPEEEGDDEELTYADVKFMQRPGRQVEPRADLEVEYGQVRFTERPQQTELRENDCVYAMVSKSR